MNAINVEYGRTTISVYAEFMLSSGMEVIANAGWYLDERRGWEFTVQVNIVGRSDWDIKAGDGAACYIERAFELLQVKCTYDEVKAVAQFLGEFKTKREPS